MKIFHTADWHLGQSFFGNDRTCEHEHFLNWLLQEVRNQRPDALLLAGDVFDNSNPTAAAERLFWGFLDQLTLENPEMRVIITTGNHDSASRMEAPAAIYRRIGVQVRTHIPKNDKGDPEWEELCIPISSIQNPEEQVIVLAVPFLHSDDYENADSPSEGMKHFYEKIIKLTAKRFPNTPIVMMAHLFAIGSKITQIDQSDYVVVGGQNAVDASGFSSHIAYTALGHIHRAQQVGGKNSNVWYSGSALPMNFSEKNYHHGINVVEISQEEGVNVSRIEYEPLRKALTIPAEGTADFDQVMNLLRSFDKCGKNDDKDLYPYIEVKVMEADPDPSMVNDILTEASSRQVKLCRIERVRPQGIKTEETQEVSTPEELMKLVPAHIARETYANVYGEEMPDEMAKLIAEIKRECEKEDTK